MSAPVTITLTIENPVQFTLSVVIPLMTATSVWLAGDVNRLCWPIAIVSQFIAGAYGVISHDWGWLLSPIIVMPVFVRNWLKWHRQRPDALATYVAESTGQPTEQPSPTNIGSHVNDDNDDDEKDRSEPDEREDHPERRRDAVAGTDHRTK